MGYHSAMLPWSQKRRLSVLAIGIAGLAFFGFFSFLILRARPDCTNGEKDGNERGVDCGGSCALLCAGEAQAPLVHFSRALQIDEKVWGAVAYLENRNKTAGARETPYVFKLYDAAGILVAERHGRAHIAPRATAAIFEGGMRVGDRVPTRAVFAFESPPRFEAMREGSTLLIRDKRFAQGESGARLEAAIENRNVTPVGLIEATALLFSPDGNVFAASATRLKELRAGSAAALSFTWPRPFDAPPARIEILYAVIGKD